MQPVVGGVVFGMNIRRVAAFCIGYNIGFHALQFLALHHRRIFGQSGAVDPRIQVYLPGMLIEQFFIQVGDKPRGVHGLEGMRFEIVIQKGIPGGAAHHFLYAAQKKAAFFIGNVGNTIVGVAAIEVQKQLGFVRGGLHEIIEGVLQFPTANLCQHFGIITAVNFFHDALLEIHGKALIQPEVAPGFVRNQVAAPAMRQFVRYQTHQAAVAGNDGGCGKGEHRIFHAAKRKARGQYQYIIAAPGIGPVERFGAVYHALHVGQFPHRFLQHTRLGIYATVAPQRGKLHIAHRQRHQVAGNGFGLFEGVFAFSVFAGRVFGTHHGHQVGRHFDAGIVGKAHSRTILQGNPGTGQDGLALRK